MLKETKIILNEIKKFAETKKVKINKNIDIETNDKSWEFNIIFDGFFECVETTFNKNTLKEVLNFLEANNYKVSFNTNYF